MQVTVCWIRTGVAELTHQNSRIPHSVRRMANRSSKVRIHFSGIYGRFSSALIAGSRLLRVTRSGCGVAQVRHPQCEWGPRLQQAGGQCRIVSRNSQSAPCQRCFSQRAEQVCQAGMCDWGSSLRLHLQPVSSGLLRLTSVMRKNMRRGTWTRGVETYRLIIPSACWA